MKVTFAKKERFMVVGYERIFNLDNMKNEDIPGFWNDVMKENLLCKIENVTNKNECLGLCTELDENKNFNYIIGVSVDKIDDLPENAKSYEIPECEYAVFTVKGEVPKAIQEAWMYIMNE